MGRPLLLFDTGPGYKNPKAREGWNQNAENTARRFEERGLEAMGGGAEVRLSTHRSAQDLTRVLPADIIIAQTLRDSLDPRFQVRALPDTPVEGIEKPIVIYAVDGFDKDGNEA